jgi:hypothetical protein
MLLIAEVNCEPFCSSATCFAVAVLKSKNVVQFALIAVVAPDAVPVVGLVALGVAVGCVVAGAPVGLFELEDGPLLPQAAAATATAQAPIIFSVCL